MTLKVQMLSPPDRTLESPTIGSGLRPVLPGTAGPGPGVYRFRALITNPLCEQWVESLGADKLASFGQEDLTVVEPLITRKGPAWPDPRTGASSTGVPEPWAPDHHNTMVGWWRPPFRRLQKNRDVPADVLRWCRFSYMSYLLCNIAHRAQLSLDYFKSGFALEFYRAASRATLGVRDLERILTLKPCLPQHLRGIISPKVLLLPRVVDRLRLELKRLEHIKVPPGCLSEWAAIAVNLKGDMSEKELHTRFRVKERDVESLMTQLRGQLAGARHGFFFVARESDEALRMLFAAWAQASPAERVALDRDFTRVAQAIRASSLLNRHGLSAARTIARAGGNACVSQHFRNMLNILDGGVASVKAQLV